MGKTKNVLVKHAGGRPTKYIPDVIYPKIADYINMCSRENTELPTVEGLAMALGVVPDTIYEWASGKYPSDYKDKSLRGKLKHPEFSVTIKEIAARQKNQLMNDGMYGGKEVNHGMAIFLLKCNHGMNDGGNVKIQVNVKPILGGRAEVENVQIHHGDQEITEVK